MSRRESPFVRDPTPDEGYTWVHRAFLHAFQTHSVMTVDEAKKILSAVLNAHDPDRPTTAADITQPHLSTTLQTINAKLSPYDFEIRSTRDQISKTLVYALVNKTSDPATQLATRFSASEIAYIRRVLDAMFDTNNTPVREVMAIQHKAASNLARPRRNRQSQARADADEDAAESQQAADQGITLTEADLVLKALVTQAFFQVSRHNYYSLAPRGLLELGSYLKDTYNELADESADGVPVIRIRDCEGCREIVTYGVRCNNRECGVRWHDACASSYYRGRNEAQKKCPGCETVFDARVYVGERADRVRPSGGGSRRESRMEVDEGEEEE